MLTFSHKVQKTVLYIYVSFSISHPHFEIDYEGSLKKVPAGFPTDTPDSDFYRLKRFCIAYMPDDDFILAPGLAERVSALFKTTKPFLDFINRAVTWSKEEK